MLKAQVVLRSELEHKYCKQQKYIISMTDFMSKETRSKLMACIRSKDTKPEMAVRKVLHAEGFRYSLHSKLLPGKPDLALKKYNIAVFIHGCFWHGHSCDQVRFPKSNIDYWKTKIENTKQRDKNAIRLLNENGWKTIIIWECSLEQDIKNLVQLLQSKRKALKRLD